MKWFFSLLLLSNLIVAGWSYWQLAPNRPIQEGPVENSAQGRLRLLSEMTPQERLPVRETEDMLLPAPPLVTESVVTDLSPSETDLEETHTTIGPTFSCLRIVTTSKPPDFEAISEKAVGLDIKLLNSGEEMVERQSYWVYIPPYESANAVRKAASLLAKAKVRDFLVVRSGEYKNGVSLGLFSQQERADKRLKQIVELKLAIRQPAIQPRSTMVRTYWILVHTSGDGHQTLQPLLEADGFQVASVDCPA